MEEQGESQHDAEVGPPGGVTARSSADETLAGPYGLPSREKIKGQTAETSLYRQKNYVDMYFYVFLLCISIATQVRKQKAVVQEEPLNPFNN